MILFLAGHETTSISLTVVFYFLALYPDIQERVRNEVCEILGDAQNSFPSFEEQQSMKLLENVIKESLRLYPVVPHQSFRVCKSKMRFGDAVITPNEILSINVFDIQRDPQNFDNPHKFIPERFNGEIKPCTWIPFGIGSRSCLGKMFSLVEQKVLISMILMQYKVSLPEDSPHRVELQNKPTGLLEISEMNLEFNKI